MKKLLPFLAVLFLIAFTNCDGKDRASKNNKEKIENSDLSSSFFEHVNYFPKKYVEVITDTILSNGFTVRIKTFSDMENKILITKKTDTITQKNYYRNWVSELQVSFKSNVLLIKTIDNSFLQNIKTIKETGLSMLQFTNIYVNQNKSLQNILVLDVYAFKANKVKAFTKLEIVIDKKGNYTLQEIEENWNKV
jgi:hypothetical protein